MNRDDIRAGDRAAQLPRRGECVRDFEVVGQPPRIPLGEPHVVFDQQQVGYVECQEAQRFLAVVELVAARRDEVREHIPGLKIGATRTLSAEKREQQDAQKARHHSASCQLGTLGGASVLESQTPWQRRLVRSLAPPT
jgi:hypothetical protein